MTFMFCLECFTLRISLSWRQIYYPSNTWTFHSWLFNQSIKAESSSSWGLTKDTELCFPSMENSMFLLARRLEINTVATRWWQRQRSLPNPLCRCCIHLLNVLETACLCLLWPYMWQIIIKYCYHPLSELFFRIVHVLVCFPAQCWRCCCYTPTSLSSGLLLDIFHAGMRGSANRVLSDPLSQLHVCYWLVCVPRS